MATKRDYYEVLSVSRDSSEREIARAYRKLAVQYHPDNNTDESAHVMFKECAEAYEVLGNSEKRSRYDRYGHEGVDGAQFGSAEDIFAAFGEIFGGGGGMFDNIFGGGGRGRVRRGNDVRAEVELTLEEAQEGAKKTINFARHEICHDCEGERSAKGSTAQTCQQCGGQGQVIQSTGILRVQTTCPRCRGLGQMITDPCPTCRGQGVNAKPVELEVAIPAGVDDGMRVRLANEGEASMEGGPNGDCYCFISVKKHRLFHRDGKNLILQLPIAYSQAALGTEIDVPTLNGAKSLKIPTGTQSGEVFRLRGKGMPDPQGGRVGDLLVQTFIETPKKLSQRQKELLQELAEIEKTDVSPQRKSFLEKIRDYFAVSED